jgi:hypothetical protein
VEIRTDLLPPDLDEAVVVHLTQLVSQIVAYLEQGNDAAALVTTFNEATGRNYSVKDFALFSAAEMNMRVFVEDALTPSPMRRKDVVDADLLAIIALLSNGEGSRREQVYWLEFLERHLPYPGISDLIFWRGDLQTPEAILAEAKSYTPIQLPGSPS